MVTLSSRVTASRPDRQCTCHAHAMHISAHFHHASPSPHLSSPFPPLPIPPVAAHAQAWATALTNTSYSCSIVHGGHDGEGQNLASASPAGIKTGADASGWWVHEGQCYTVDVHPNGCAGGNWAKCGHYTQVIWNDTLKLGCGKASCAGADVWACHYYPSGNWGGQWPYGERPAAQPLHPSTPQAPQAPQASSFFTCTHPLPPPHAFIYAHAFHLVSTCCPVVGLGAPWCSAVRRSKIDFPSSLFPPALSLSLPSPPPFSTPRRHHRDLPGSARPVLQSAVPLHLHVLSSGRQARVHVWSWSGARQQLAVPTRCAPAPTTPSSSTCPSCTSHALPIPMSLHLPSHHHSITIHPLIVRLPSFPLFPLFLSPPPHTPLPRPDPCIGVSCPAGDLVCDGSTGTAQCSCPKGTVLVAPNTCLTPVCVGVQCPATSRCRASKDDIPFCACPACSSLVNGTCTQGTRY
ncbi:unnamed protein product [Closterium sp. NIES-54]